MSEAEIIYRGIKAPWDNHVVDILDFGRYPGGEPLVNWDNSIRVTKILLRPKSMDTFLAAMFWVDSMVERGCSVPDLFLPYLPGARQDRLNSAGDYLFTAKSVAKMINDRNFPSVTVIDPHSEVMPGMIDRCRVLDIVRCLKGPRDRWVGIISPDAGAEKRANQIGARFELPVFHGWKTRNVANGALSGFGLQPIPAELQNGRFLVVDDICDGGGTFIGLGQTIRDAGITADLYVTHGIFSRSPKALFNFYENIYTTDSVISDKPGVHVTNVCHELI